jgi:putative oxidoreductase
MAAIAGLSEAGGGLLLALGLLTPLGAAMVMGVMFVAGASVHAPNGLWATNGGYELPLTNALVACGLGFTGAGPWSLDATIGIRGMSGWWAGIGALLLAVVGASLVLLRRHHVLATEQAAAYPAEPVPADPATLPRDHVSASR